MLHGHASLLDHKRFNQWKAQSPENEKLYDTLLSFWKGTQKRPLTEREKKQVERLLQYAKGPESTALVYTSTSRMVWNVLRYAAAGLLLLGTGFLAARMTLSHPMDSNTAEVMVPSGSRAQITLPDGTIVWLGHESHLSYPDHFTGNSREVNLTGEAFFNVESDKAHPFLVHTSGPTIRVTGTEFYIKDYPTDPVVETSLISGKIDLVIHDRILQKMDPGTSIIYTKQTAKLVAAAFEKDYYDFWKNGEYTFKDKPFRDLASMMKRIYNVNIVFSNPELGTKRFTGSMGSADNVYTLLEVFKKSSSVPFRYTVDKNTIYISGKTH
jgi:ferric-dicitrate binding protein FerR (iron transport regulator)